MIPQHLEALHHANEVRIARGKLKHRISVGRISPAKALEHPIAVRVSKRRRAGMTVAELLGAQQKWGRVRTQRFLSKLGLDPRTGARPVGLLTERQRQLIRDGLKR